MAEDSSEIVREQSESVAAANLKVLGDGPAFYTNLSLGNAVAHQQAMQAISAASVGNIVKRLTEVDPLEAISVLKSTSGNDLAQQLAQLMSTLAATQQGVKAGQTTPPVTG